MPVMATSDVAKQVAQLKLQLTDTSKSTTLLKALQKLQDLDVSLDILSETGIGKTVNSLRKHKEVGEVAKSLVKYWKKLVPKGSASNPLEESKSKHSGHHDDVHGSRDSKDKPAPNEKKHSISETEKACKDKESNKKWPKTKLTPEVHVPHPLPSRAEAKYSKTLPDSASDKEDTTETLKSCQLSKSKKKKVVEKKESSMKIKNKSENDRPSNASIKKAKTKLNNSSGPDLEDSSMSFESYLSYDANALKRKARTASKQPPKKSKTLEKGEAPRGKQQVKSIKGPLLSGNGISTNKVKDNVMDLLNIPLPEFLPDCDKFSTVDYYETKRVEKELSDGTGEPHFTGQRLNKKMQVYSGNKTFLPSMISLYQQCIRALQNNINLLYDTGGVPFEILEPVLERCTPDQLLRIEEFNPSYIGVSDHLWGKHCERDFRGATLLEYESWKEMHLRLSEERENKFKRLAKTIVSAHSKKPQGRQVKMAFIHTVAKPPRDVRIQQELYGTAGPVVQPGVVKASVKSHEHRASPRCIETPKSAPSNSGTANSQDPRKKQRVAPMMAKSLKAFKKQLGRR